MRSIQIGNTAVEYDLIFSNRKKTIGLSIDHNKKLTVRAPKKLSEDDVKTNLFLKAKWIITHLERMEEIQEEESKEFVSGEKFLLRGRRYRLKVLKSEEATEASLTMKSGRFIATIPAYIPESDYRKHLRPLFMDYYQQKAEQVINERIDRYLKYFDEHPSGVLVKEYKSKWGSCSKDNQLRFNWKIVMAKTSIIDYLVVHELCHMEHKNHSKDYWKAVQVILPDYGEKRKWLRVHGNLLNI
ncbi:putative metal-dependent hydrolase [Methanohalophilus levihalophilus]|uniref:M48 family metallopeptidase n=1 Tax=Methanohalophilus levihalophilus TaxID=1431282 RepID=UPI001AEA4E37|nr:SprT family zinc-dependent metalloprotease [Methanohalophilus levihalophilus]MBP2030791.1 putative metal-dependent hydrolase [Methanohalophilus levihalophilus]